MKQLNITSLLIVLLSMIGFNASAHDIEVKNADGITIYYNYINNNTELEVTYKGSYNNSYLDEYTGDIVIPVSVTYNGKTYSVTSIGQSAFYGCSGLISIDFPNSVTSIGNYAFNECSGLTSATIPNSVTSIGQAAFADCSGIASVTIGNSVMSIGGYAFSGCKKITSVTIPNSVENIGYYAFSRCSGLTSITIPNSVTSIGDAAFSSCPGLTSIKVQEGNTKYNSRNNCNAIVETSSNTLVTGCKNTVIPNSVMSIGDCAFYSCSGLTSVDIPNSVTIIGSSAFSGCSSLTSITIPNSVTGIGDFAFARCSSLTSITIPSSLTSIGSSTFYGCSGLASVTIGNNVTSIGYGAFYGCSNLISIKIPESMTSIGEWAFSGCSALKNVYNGATIPQALASDPGFNYTTATLHVPAGTKELYQAAEYWKNFSNIVEDINTVIVEDDKKPAIIVEGEKFYILLLDNETVKYADIISVNEAGKERIAIKDGGLLIVKGDDVRFALSDIKKGDILVFDFIGKIRCLYGTLTANAAQQNSFPLVTSSEMELESGMEYIANEDCDVVLEMETTDAPVELKSITITEPTRVSIVENSTSNSLSGKAYNLAGQQVNADSKGLTIQAGKKIIKH